MGAFNRYPRWQRLPCAHTLQSLLFGFILTAGQAQEFHVPWVLPAAMGWVSPMVDREGNTLFLGEYVGQNITPLYGTTKFGDFTLAPLPAGNFSACIAKADIHGSPLWLRPLAVSSLNGAVYPYMSALTAHGEIVMVGSLYGTATMSGVTLSSPQDHEVPLIVKLRQDGEVLWARRLVGSAGAAAQGLAIDPSGKIVVRGQFASDLSIDGQSITRAGGGGFLASFSPEGQAFWLRDLPTAPSVIAVDDAGNAFLAGQGRNGLQFGPFTLVTGGVADAYVAKYGADGTCEWLFGCGSEVSDDAWGVAVTRDGFCYLAATAGGGGGAATVVTVGSTTIQAGRSEISFLVVLNSAGEPHAVVPFEGMSSFRGAVGSLAVDRHDNAVVLAHATLAPVESAGTLQIGDRSLTVDATLNSVLFAANVQPDGVCNWILPLSRFHNTGGNSYLSIQPPASPAMSDDDSMRIALFTAGTQTLGTFQLSGRYVARIDLPVTKPALRFVTSATQMRLTWPNLASGFSLESATTLENGGNWQDLEATPELEGDELVVAVDLQPPGARFFRLSKQ